MGNGIYSNSELVESLIVDLNTIPKYLVNGQFIIACAVIAQMGNKLNNLRDGIKSDIDGKNKTIEQLKETIRSMGQEIEEMTPQEFIEKFNKKDGADNGKD